MLRFGLIPFTVFPGIGIPLLFQVIHPDCADFGIAAQSLDTAAVFDTMIGIGLAYGMGFKCSVYLETCFLQTFAPTVLIGVEFHFIQARYTFTSFGSRLLSWQYFITCE